ncbi:DUF7563 family protein [Natrinema salifodinae]|uniref:Small CPxCG-related zinc finger protein n=1 Tax=Natrinema salifodinae TaxID=1202768 RepID=A0A1I0QVE3_9EURY|nr:hypothetical protein [Natrinema salifodinae]SEW31549.1 hypothetical protein SAMN05216285_4014 [Natrinema salifodinae]
MPTCGNCGAYVTRDFVRVFGVDGDIQGCPDCATYRELYTGAGVVHPAGNENQSASLPHSGR